jgi:hypothetical protein
MTRRPRLPDELVELFESKKDHKNQNIGDIILDEFPELEDELQERKKSQEKSDLDTDLFDGGGLLD